jgi:protein-tyrosine phosphatase
MERNRKIGNILVHCMIGKSRSATIVAAYLVRKYKYSLNNVLSMLKRKRKKVFSYLMFRFSLTLVLWLS